MVQLPHENHIIEEYLYTHDYLSQNNYDFYEVSNFAKKGKESRHNLLYWQQEEYLGLGPSASGTINRTRYQNIPQLKEYINRLNSHQLPVIHEETLNNEQWVHEKVMLSLRTREGLDCDTLQKISSTKWYTTFQNKVSQYIKSGHLVQNGKYLSATKRGLLLLDHIILNIV